MLGPDHRKTLYELSPGNLYLVGGSVRDMLMNREGTDTDITVVGDARELAARFAQAAGGQCTIHERFGTATVTTNDGQSIDLITARSETYPAPGALPKVRPGTLEEDLARRDFSINAMAMPLDSTALIDQHNGQKDLALKVIRTLHPNSFQDDPTRIFRAIRYEQRLQFKIPSLTLIHLIGTLADQALDNVSGDRVRHELERTAQEAAPLPTFRRMAELGVFSAIHPHWDPDFSHIPQNWKPDPMGWTAISTWTCEPHTLDSIIERLSMPRDWNRTLQDTNQLRRALQWITKDSNPEDVCEALDPLRSTLEELDIKNLGIKNLAPESDGAISKYFSEWQYVRPRLGGRDLIKMGVPEGPERGQLLRDLRTLRMNHPKTTRKDEETLVKRFLEKKAPQAWE